MKRFVVTGAAGFIGSHLVERLLEEGHSVTGVDSFDPYYDPSFKRANLLALERHPNFTLREDDLAECDLRFFTEADAVFHLAGQPGVRDSWGTGFPAYVRNNVIATQRILETLHEHRSQVRVIAASSSSVYGNAALPLSEDGPVRPHSPYGITKLAAENLCSAYARNLGVAAVSLRFFTVFGPRQRPDMAFARFFEAIAAGRPLKIFGDGSQTRDFTYVEDIVDGLLLAYEHGNPGEVYNVGGGNRVALMDAIQKIERVTGLRAKIEPKPGQPGDVADTLASTDKAARRLNYHPRVTLEEGLERQARSLGVQRRIFAHTQRSAARARIALYSHDTYGLGHLRRNVALARRLLATDANNEVLLLTGSSVADRWTFPEGLIVRKLPPVVKTGAERYASLDAKTTFDQVKAQRESVIVRALDEFRPDVLVVDHAPAGMKGELRALFHRMHADGWSTRLILGLRDIIDDPYVVRSLWKSEGIYDILEGCYERIFVYGSPTVCSAEQAYALPPRIAAKLRYCGYVVDSNLDATQPSAPDARFRILVEAGGGGDGYPLLRDFITAIERLNDDSITSVLLAGPLMPSELARDLQERAGSLSQTELLAYSTQPEDLLARADLVVSMAGYNTAAEILAARKPAILCPRQGPRAEQLIRAQIFEARGLAWSIEPSPDRVTRLVEFIADARKGAVPEHLQGHDIPLDGAVCAAAQIESLIGDTIGLRKSG